MRITVNGESKEFDAPLAIADLLKLLELEPRKIAVERNLAIVPKSTYGEIAVCDGDRIEIVQFVGGG